MGEMKGKRTHTLSIESFLAVYNSGACRVQRVTDKSIYTNHRPNITTHLSTIHPPNLARAREPSNSTRRSIRPTSDLLRTPIALHHARVPITVFVVALARIGDLASITIVTVDTTKHTAINSRNAINDDVPRSTVGSAIAA